MGWRFRKSFKILPGIRLNLGKKGFTSIGIGRGPFTTNVNKDGVRNSLSAPGTGLSYQTKRTSFLGGSDDQSGSEPQRDVTLQWIRNNKVIGYVAAGIGGICVLMAIGASISTIPQPRPAGFSSAASPTPTVSPTITPVVKRPVGNSKKHSRLKNTPQKDSLAVVPLVLPSEPAAAQTERNSMYIRGPRGGCYYKNSHGNKTYVERSLCN
jgi:energy-converting hydrogenase Eha subunit A